MVMMMVIVDDYGRTANEMKNKTMYSLWRAYPFFIHVCLLLPSSSFLLFLLPDALGADINVAPLLLPAEEGKWDMDMDVNRALASISISKTWHVLGPFKTGTREATWGADPLEVLGGFRNMSYTNDPAARFSSALGVNGSVGWSILEATEPERDDSASTSAKVTLDVGFPDVDWELLRSFYGWAGLQYQAWARGHFNVTTRTVAGGYTSSSTVAVYTDGLLEVWIDGEPFFGGDFYAYRRAPVTLKLAAGSHVVDLRLVRDVRALGGVGEPRIRAAVEVQLIQPSLAGDGTGSDDNDEVVLGLKLDAGSVLVADVVEGKLASPFASVIVRNEHDGWAEITDIKPVRDIKSTRPMVVLIDSPITLAPHQSRPIGLKIDFDDQAPSNFSFQLVYTIESAGKQRKTNPVTATAVPRKISDPQKYTFLHPSGIVSYAILRPPLNASCNSAAASGDEHRLPILVDLHGAGLEAGNEQVRHMLDDAYGVCSWILFPTGVTPWSGDDWHTWGAADVQAAVDAIPNWMQSVAWEGLGAALDDWLVSGHSNGGQGTWFFLTHQPDKVIAAAPVSGYSSIENYVPFTMWHDGQATIASVIQTARQSFKHELLMGNFRGIPILQQHGSADDNVPAYHSRLLHQLIWENGWHSEYHELSGKGHWFDGVLTTQPLLDFYSRHTSNSSSYDHLLPERFSFSIPNSGDMGSRGGIMVDQLSSPDKFGHIQATRKEEGVTWHLKARNVHRFHLLPSRMRVAVYPRVIVVTDGDGGGSESTFLVPAADQAHSKWFVKDEITGSWTVSNDGSWQDDIRQRYGRQNGAMDAILRSTGRFTIRVCSRDSDGSEQLINVALQISRNLLQYFAADSQLLPLQTACNSNSNNSHSNNNDHIIDDQEEELRGPGNLITISIGNDLPPPPASLVTTFPIHIANDHLTIRTTTSNLHTTTPTTKSYPFEPDLGAIFLRPRPLPHQRLELVVWGADLGGLRQASRLVPLLTGVGQPDFVVLSEQCRWRGFAGAYAAGFFDFGWRVSAGSYVD
ncbi:hypothetical protein, variant [Blastomyces dermatitidis ATCC 26199]|nr:hypothetical protein BDFG_04094 [Blastomyces dermatitidis ATCC 26199]EQL33941.1 hypothetical protein, variant [Blastomyces dermatitidis ATCC 26199]